MIVDSPLFKVQNSHIIESLQTVRIEIIKIKKSKKFKIKMPPVILIIDNPFYVKPKKTPTGKKSELGKR